MDHLLVRLLLVAVLATILALSIKRSADQSFDKEEQAYNATLPR